jgi:L-ascorbate metabolism protein UlaG (beta-lactamase superfamily)
MLNLLKMIGISIGSVMLLIAVIGFLFIKTSPQFGGKHTSEDIARYKASGHYAKGKFMNLTPTVLDMSFSAIVNMLKDFAKGNPNKSPKFDLPVEHIDSTNIANNTEARLIWFGHSAFLLQLDDKNILIDPMLGNTPAPHPTLGSNRFSKSLPIDIEKQPQIDAIIISHDHYDHLDYGSIQQLKEKTKKFFVPLGVGAHLESWGIAKENIKEHNWWDESTFEGIQLAFTPSRHFSGRGLGDNATTLWGSWVIKGKNKNIYFSGDGGYGPHFKEIGDKYGPFDFAMMECGQYNDKWAQIHMMPEETAQAALDVNTKLMMPIHWGAFTLALHDWNDPVIRVTKKAEELKMPITVPKIGEIITLDNQNISTNKWWIKE